MRKIYLLLIIFLSFAGVACKSNENTPVLNEKILLRTDKYNASEIRVILEGEDGNCIDGAFVAIRSDGNDYSILDYNSENRCYYDKFDFGSLENIVFVIDSILLKEKKEIEVPHFQLVKKPLLTVFADEEGNSVLQGKKVNPEKEIQIAWNFPIEDCTYKVSISTSVDTIYEVSTKSMTVFIPKNVLENGKYYFLKVEAQKIKGDILFEKENYYSVSVTETENVQFTTK